MEKRLIKAKLNKNESIEQIVLDIGDVSESTLSDFLNVIECLISLKKYDDAELVLNMLRDKYPNNGQALYYLGVVKVSQKQIEFARDCFCRALENNYITSKCLMSLALIEKLIGNQEKAIELMDQACVREEDNPIPELFMISNLLNSRRYDKLLKVSRRFEMKHPDNYEFFHCEIISLINMKQSSLAKKRLEEIKEKFSLNAKYVYDKAYVLYLEKDYKEALNILRINESVVDIESLEYCQLIAQIFIKLEMKEESIDAHRKLYKISKQNNIAISLATLLLSDKKIFEADTYLMEVINSNIIDRNYYVAWYMHTTCVSLIEKDRNKVISVFKEAINLYEAACEKNSGNTYVMGFAAECYEYIGDTERAKQCRNCFENFQKEYNNVLHSLKRKND